MNFEENKSFFVKNFRDNLCNFCKNFINSTYQIRLEGTIIITVDDESFLVIKLDEVLKKEGNNQFYQNYSGTMSRSNLAPKGTLKFKKPRVTSNKAKNAPCSQKNPSINKSRAPKLEALQAPISENNCRSKENIFTEILSFALDKLSTSENTKNENADSHNNISNNSINSNSFKLSKQQIQHYQHNRPPLQQNRPPLQQNHPSLQQNCSPIQQNRFLLQQNNSKPQYQQSQLVRLNQQNIQNNFSQLKQNLQNSQNSIQSFQNSQQKALTIQPYHQQLHQPNSSFHVQQAVQPNQQKQQLQVRLKKNINPRKIQLTNLQTSDANTFGNAGYGQAGKQLQHPNTARMHTKYPQNTMVNNTQNSLLTHSSDNFNQIAQQLGTIADSKANVSTSSQSFMEYLYSYNSNGPTETYNFDLPISKELLPSISSLQPKKQQQPILTQNEPAFLPYMLPQEPQNQQNSQPQQLQNQPLFKFRQHQNQLFSQSQQQRQNQPFPQSQQQQDLCHSQQQKNQLSLQSDKQNQQDQNQSSFKFRQHQNQALLQSSQQNQHLSHSQQQNQHLSHSQQQNQHLSHSQQQNQPFLQSDQQNQYVPVSQQQNQPLLQSHQQNQLFEPQAYPSRKTHEVKLSVTSSDVPPQQIAQPRDHQVAHNTISNQPEPSTMTTNATSTCFQSSDIVLNNLSQNLVSTSIPHKGLLPINHLSPTEFFNVPDFSPQKLLRASSSQNCSTVPNFPPKNHKNLVELSSQHCVNNISNFENSSNDVIDKTKISLASQSILHSSITDLHLSPVTRPCSPVQQTQTEFHNFNIIASNETVETSGQQSSTKQTQKVSKANSGTDINNNCSSLKENISKMMTPSDSGDLISERSMNGPLSNEVNVSASFVDATESLSQNNCNDYCSVKRRIKMNFKKDVLSTTNSYTSNLLEVEEDEGQKGGKKGCYKYDEKNEGIKEDFLYCKKLKYNIKNNIAKNILGKHKKSKKHQLKVKKKSRMRCEDSCKSNESGELTDVYEHENADQAEQEERSHLMNDIDAQLKKQRSFIDHSNGLVNLNKERKLKRRHKCMGDAPSHHKNDVQNFNLFCKSCGMRETSLYNMASHYTDLHSKVVSNRKVRCYVCWHACPNLPALKAHLARKHKSNKIF